MSGLRIRHYLDFTTLQILVEEERSSRHFAPRASKVFRENWERSKLLWRSRYHGLTAVYERTGQVGKIQRKYSACSLREEPRTQYYASDIIMMGWKAVYYCGTDDSDVYCVMLAAQ